MVRVRPCRRCKWWGAELVSLWGEAHMHVQPAGYAHPRRNVRAPTHVCKGGVAVAPSLQASLARLAVLPQAALARPLRAAQTTACPWRPRHCAALVSQLPDGKQQAHAARADTRRGLDGAGAALSQMQVVGGRACLALGRGTHARSTCRLRPPSP